MHETEPIPRIGPMSDEERIAHGREWLERCRAELDRAEPFVRERELPRVEVPLLREPDDVETSE